MASGAYYKSLALLLIAEANAADDPTAATALRKRAEEYLLLAEAFEKAKPPESAETPIPPSSPVEHSQPVAQQQQQEQPTDEKEKKGGNGTNPTSFHIGRQPR